MVFVMKGPRGGIIEATVSTTKDGAQTKAYNYLHNTTAWAKNPEFAYNWDGFIAERRRRGFRVCKARLTVMARVEE